jgi:branched-subunit amino acid transport protein
VRTDILLIILGMAAVTFFTRFGAQLAFRSVGLPPWINRWLRHVPTAILTALIVPPIVLPAGRLDLTWHNPYLLAGVLAALVAWRFRNIPLTMGIGLAAIIILRAI